jgi:predicted nucleic acid-binding protein
MLVLDANILIRAVLGRRIREILEQYAPLGIRFLAPDVAYADAERYLPALLAKRGKPEADLPAALRYLRNLVEPIESEIYQFHQEDARERLRGRDEEDWPVLAAALALNCAIWTEDTDFFGTGAAVWTTSRVDIFLKAQLRLLEAEER